MNSQNAINVALYEKLSFDFVRDTCRWEGRERSAGHGGPPLGAGQDHPQVHRLRQANPGKLNMASAGIGGPQHIAGELFKFMAGVDLTHIPYKGSTPAVTDLVAGQGSTLRRPHCRRSRPESSGRWA